MTKENKEKTLEEVPKPEKKEERTIVVKELPQQDVRQALDDKGNTINLIPMEEALTEILKICRRLKNLV